MEGDPRFDLHLILLFTAFLKLGSPAFDVRFVDNDVPSAGRVEVRFSSVWRSICDINWDVRDAHVVCRMKGYSQGALAAIKGFSGSGGAWLSNVNCSGDETTLERCNNLNFGLRNCINNRRAGVICNSDRQPNVAVRLVNGSAPNQGRVEVRYYGVWGTICDDSWRLPDAHVVCRMLNYSKATWAGIAKVGGSGPIIFEDVICRGNEKSLELCRNSWGRRNCGHYQDAAVTCQNSTQVIVRLVGNQRHAGRVEVNYNGTWRPVCDDTWDILDAHVVCRMLGYKAALLGMKRFSVGKKGLWMVGVECSGEEVSISDCYHRGWSNTICPESFNAGVVCRISEAQSPNVAVRLMNGSTPNQGRVEVRYYGVWGTVCDDRWGLADAHVVCRMLNYSKASWAGTAKVKGSGYILLDEVMCLGKEKSLEYCKHQGWGQHNCGHGEDAGVTCENVTKEESSITVRIVGVKDKHFSFIEVNYNGTWIPVCDDTWDILDAHVVCRMLGYKAALAAIKRFSVEKAGLWMSGVECSGEEVSISECYHRGWSNTGCPGNYYAGVMCKVTEDPPPVQVRLEEGSSPNSGRVAVRYGNVWGTICNRGLDINDAKVICRMLGYVGGVRQYTSKPGNGTIWLSNLRCNGTEKSIVDCLHPGWGQTTKCNHDNDAAILCKKADAPKFQINGSSAITDSTVVILFEDLQPNETQLKSVRQVAVEKRNHEHRFKSYSQPLPYVFSEVNVTTATNMGNDSYITAEVQLGPVSNLTIGDGQYYHGYYNAPLEPGSRYRVHVRIVTMAMDGQRINGDSAFVAFTTRQLTNTRVFEKQDSSSRLKGAVIGLSVVIVVLIFLFIGCLVWFTLRKKKGNKKDSSTEMSDIIIANSVAREPPRASRQTSEEQHGRRHEKQTYGHRGSNLRHTNAERSENGTLVSIPESNEASESFRHQVLKNSSQELVNDAYEDGIVI